MLGRRLSPAELRAAMRLYLVTDSRWLAGRSLEHVVDEAIDGGITFVQLREKGASTQKLVELGRPLVELCRKREVPFVVNDDVEAARLLHADGVHVGQSDAHVREAWVRLGDDAIVGVSVQTRCQALLACEAGASYLGAGAMFATGTKRDAQLVSSDTLREICAEVGAGTPVVAIGGIDAGNACELAGLGVDGVAAVSAIMSASDVRAAARELRSAVAAFGGVGEGEPR